MSTNYLFPLRPVGGDPHERYGHFIETYKIQTTYIYVNNENKIRKRSNNCSINIINYAWFRSNATFNNNCFVMVGLYRNCLPFREQGAVCVTRFLVLCVSLVDRCLSFCAFSFDHCACVVCSSSIYEFVLPLWDLQTLLTLNRRRKTTDLSYVNDQLTHTNVCF